MTDATWSVPGATAISGVARGADAVVEQARSVVDGGLVTAAENIISDVPGLDAFVEAGPG